MLLQILADLVTALRHLRRSAGFSLLVMGLLAVALGGVITMFSAVNGLLLAPLPYADAERLVRVGHDHPERGAVYGAFSPDDVADLAAGSRSFDAVASYFYWPGQSTVNSRIGERPEQLEAGYVSPAFFTTLVAPPLLGRALGPADHRPGEDRVAVISHRTWRTLFASDPGIVGRDLRVNGEAFTVVGVMPAEFDFPSAKVQVWLPLSRVTEAMIPHRRDVRWLAVVARLAPGVGIGAAQRETTALLERLAETHPQSNEGWGRARVQPLLDAVVGKDRGPVLAVFAATLAVLLIACVNLANLLLARASRRAREFAVKGAIGGAPSRLARQMLFEALLLAIGGGIAGLVLAAGALRGLATLVEGSIARVPSIALDARVAAFAIGLSLLTALACGLLPARMVRRSDPARALGHGAAGGAGNEARVRGALVVAQIALVCGLGYAAGVVVDSLRRLAAVDLGVEPGAVLTFNVKLSGARYAEEGGIARGRDALLERIRAMPGVIRAAASKNAPIGETGERYGFTLPDRPEVEVRPEWGALFVTEDYFAALGIPLLRGRDFAAREAPASGVPLIVNQAFADRFFGGADPVGQVLRFGESGAAAIVGLVGNARHAGPALPPAPVVYAPSTMFSRSSVTVSLRSAARTPDLFERVRDAVWSVDPDLPILGMRWLDDGVSRLQAQPRLVAALLGGFAVLAAVIGGVGIYSLLAFVVAARRRELAVRIAIGAAPRRLYRGVMAQGARLGTWGLLLGVPLGFVAARWLEALVYEPVALPPLVLAAIGASTLALVVAASAGPAASALRTDPMAVLREE